MTLHSTPTLYHDLQRIRTINPVIHNVTNFVTMETIANILLAVGASPIMAHSKNELSNIIKLAHALILNIGTLDENWIESFLLAQQFALSKNIPVILDPVGSGASFYRTQTTKTLLEKGISVLRGNASEIMSLIDENKFTKGVDATHASDEAITAAKYLSEMYDCTVVISGQKDIVIAKHQKAFIEHGTALFTKVVGMGCAVTAFIGAFAAINSNYFQAASHAMAIFSYAGEIAASYSKGPGTFYLNLLDTLFGLEKSNLSLLSIHYAHE